MRKIAVTGISGYLGGKMLQRLEQQEDVESIVGIDWKPPRCESPKLKFVSRDIRESFSDVFVEEKVDSAIHLAFAVNPSHDYEGARRINREGAQNFIEACRDASVGHALYLSSHTSYGPHPDNPNPLTEESALRPIRGFQYSWDKGAADRMFQDFMKQNTDIRVAIVRACSILGPQGVGSVSTGMFQFVMMRLAGYNPLIQFLHEDDLVEVITTLVERKQPGVFNAAGENPMTYKEIIKATGKPCIVMPAAPISLLLTLTWRLRLQSASPPGGLDFIKYPIVISTEKIRETTGFRFQYSTPEVLTSYLEAERNRS